MGKAEKFEILDKLYTDASHPAGYSNPTVLYKYAKPLGVKRKDVKEYLRQQESYTLHKPIRKRFKRNRIVVYNIDQQWEVDLADLPAISDQNDDYRYLFCCIDVLSKYAWVLALKRKTGPVLEQAFKKLLESSGRKPTTVRADKGGEFNNRLVIGYLKEQGIHFFVSQNEVKCAIVERFQRTLKGYMWRYFTKSGNHRWLDKLQDFVHAYNHRVHRSIKRRPVDVTPENAEEVRKTLYEKETLQDTKFKFKVGDAVRISKAKGLFEKGYQQNWTEEIFHVTKRLKSGEQLVYKIKDSARETLAGTFYEVELQKVTPPEYYRIEKVVRTRGRGEKKEYLIKWQGYPKSANTWINQRQLK